MGGRGVDLWYMAPPAALPVAAAVKLTSFTWESQSKQEVKLSMLSMPTACSLKETDFMPLH